MKPPTTISSPRRRPHDRRPPPTALRRDLLDADLGSASSHDPPELLAFYAGLRAQAQAQAQAQASGAAVLDAAPPPRDDAARAAIDRTRAAYSGPYSAEGQRVTAAPMFRLTGGYPSQTKIPELRTIVGQPLTDAMAFGQASPRPGGRSDAEAHRRRQAAPAAR